MAYDKHNDLYIMPRTTDRSSSQQAFWEARDAISSYILTDKTIGDERLNVVVGTAQELLPVKHFLSLAGNSEILQQLSKHWVNEAISSALKKYIDSKE